MDWAQTVKTTRKRLKMNQEGFAALLGISQTTISRLEAGHAEPTEDVRAKLEQLRQDPRTRSVFDDFVAAIEFSPYCSFLILPTERGYILEAVSEELKSVFPVIAETLNDIPGVEALSLHLDALLTRGFESGRVESAVGVWADSQQPTGYWKVVYSPMRDGTGAWYVFAAMMKTSEADYETHRAAHDGGLAITSFSETVQP